MNILCITHRLPYPPNKGEKIRSFHQIWHLAKRHRVHIACLVDSPEDWQYLDAMRGFCASVDAAYRQKTLALSHAALGLLTSLPLSVAAFHSRELQSKIHQRLQTEQFDCILVCSSAMAGYVWQRTDIPKVIDFMDVDSEKWRCYADYHTFPFSALYRLEAKRLSRYEEVVARRFDHVIFTSNEEVRLFRQRIADRPLSMISNGVDLDYFSPLQNSLEAPVPPPDPSALVFTGVMDYFPNVDAVRYFCTEILPRIQKQLPRVCFTIVGRNPAGPVKELAHLPQVRVTGGVPDVRPYLGQAGVAVAPFRIARGIQNKVLEAMAMGLPVVGTSQAFQGLQATDQDGIRIADTPDLFAQEIVSLFAASPTERSRLAQQARRYVEHHHQWQTQGVKLEQLLASTVPLSTRVPTPDYAQAPQLSAARVSKLDKLGEVGVLSSPG